MQHHTRDDRLSDDTHDRISRRRPVDTGTVRHETSNLVSHWGDLGRARAGAKLPGEKERARRQRTVDDEGEEACRHRRAGHGERRVRTQRRRRLEEELDAKGEHGLPATSPPLSELSARTSR